MSKYVCFWNSKQATVSAVSTFQAQQIALSHFKAYNKRCKILAYQITVVLADSNDQAVVHNPSDITG